ncbi:tyrosine-type recombinase/integrase [Allorhodopirellula solitaria]|uniref:Tyrosine recombinase XerC n=1 Tax=Allorhodopirellula solitaria TaxID=2527987 RepID=A0A5C5XS60_9BACT|nr:tyrosine-type recombinase/integrase [Allorhodopirellula solitaria]TWT64865.1 Tyrosine recombinase XerC [Allorhodopirellula solitaria]
MHQESQTVNVSDDTLRDSYATGLLEAGVDLLTISKLLGHASFVTTMIYLHCRREHMISTPSPLDWLPVQQLPTYQPPAENGRLESRETERAETEEPNPPGNPAE